MARKLPPEGCMWDPLNNNQAVPISYFEQACKARLVVWDSTLKHKHKFYYKNDPSYWWAEHVKRKRGAK